MQLDTMDAKQPPGRPRAAHAGCIHQAWRNLMKRMMMIRT
jgi:hypothetical protein